MRHILAATAVILSVASGTVQAANLVTNPGFETGDLTGWSQSGSVPAAVATVDPHTGTYHWSSGALSAPNILSQSITTDSGESYTLSFYLGNSFDNAGTPNSWEVQWNGATLDGATDAAPFNYSLFSNTVTGTGSDTVSFLLRNDPGFYILDDVSLVVSTIEPASLAILGSAFAGLGAVRRRRR